MAETLEQIREDLERLGKHMRVYDRGAYPAFYLQMHTPLRFSEISRIKLKDLCYIEEGKVKMVPDIVFEGKRLKLSSEERMELAHCVLQRIPVTDTTEDVLNGYLCLSSIDTPLSIQTYGKILRRTCDELGFKKRYSSCDLRSLYGYFEIVAGRKTIDEVALEYGVTQFYLLNRIFAGKEIRYADSLLNQVANNKEAGSDD